MAGVPGMGGGTGTSAPVLGLVAQGGSALCSFHAHVHARIFINNARVRFLVSALCFLSAAY